MTICTRDRACLFGHIEDGQSALSDAGEIARAVWNGLPSRFPWVGSDEYVIMPNHIHGILFVGAQ